MAQNFISRGFKGRERQTNNALKERTPPGRLSQHDNELRLDGNAAGGLLTKSFRGI
jgi:hypothetical protein